jgi:hypothetical protein
LFLLAGCFVQPQPQPQPYNNQQGYAQQNQQGYAQGGAQSPGQSRGVQYQAQTQQVTINGSQIPPATLMQLAQAGLPLPSGHYWYDRTCGAFGRWGAPTALFIPAGMNLGGQLPENASNGTTTVWINGRRLTVQEVQYISALIQSPVQPGRYWLDANGNTGFEGGPAIANLVAIARQRGSAGAGGGGGGGGSNTIHKGWGGTYSSDGKCYYVSTSSGSVMGPGC